MTSNSIVLLFFLSNQILCFHKKLYIKKPGTRAVGLGSDLEKTAKETTKKTAFGPADSNLNLVLVIPSYIVAIITTRRG